MILLSLSIPFMVLGVAIAVVPLLWATRREQRRKQQAPAAAVATLPERVPVEPAAA